MLTCFAVLAALGLLVGTVWELVAPRLDFLVTKKGTGYQIYPESEALVAADGWFALIGAGVGLASGAALWWWRRARGPLVLLGLAAASLLGSYIAWKFGGYLGRHPTRAEAATLLATVGNVLHEPLRLQAKAVLLFQPAGAVLGYVIGAAFAADDTLCGRQKHATAHRAGWSRRKPAPSDPAGDATTS